MKVKKPLKVIFATLGVILLLLVLDVFFVLGPTLKLAAEKIGSKALGTPLTIERLSIHPLKGTVQMTGFSIANHDAFNRSNTVSLASMDLSVDMGSLFSETVTVHRVAINSPHFIYEQNPESDNISEFIKNIQAFAGTDPDSAKEKELLAEEPAGKRSKAVIVESLEINDIQLHLANTDNPRLDIDAGIEQLTVSMTNGMAKLHNLHVSNPGRLMTTNLFELAEIRAEIDPSTFYADRLSIRDIQVLRPYLYLEQNSETDTAAEFVKIAARLAARIPIQKTTDETETVIITPDDAPASPPVELHNLTISDIQLKLAGTTPTTAAPDTRMLAGIGSVSVRQVDGLMQIREITIPNPQGFETTNLFHLAEIDISIDPDSVFSDQVSIETIMVYSPEINLEQTENSGNVAELKTVLAGFALPAKNDTESGPEVTPADVIEPAPVPIAEMPVILHTLIVTNFAVNLHLPPTTNNAVPGLADIANLNPLGKISLGGLNPLSTKEDSGTNTQVNAEAGPLKLVAFDLLTIEPLKGLLQIDGLQVANPPGFANRTLVEISKFSIELDPDTLQSDTLFIRDILIDKPRFTYERKLMTDNIKALQAEIEKATAGKGAKEVPTAEEPDDSGDADEDRKVVIEQLLAKDGSVKAKLSVIPSTPPIPLPDIRLKDLGKSEDIEEQGADLSDALTEISDTFYDAIIGTVSSATGFGMDALKSVGALLPEGGSTNGVTNVVVSLESSVFSEDRTAAEADLIEEPVINEPAEKTNKRRRSFFHKRRRIL